MVLTTRPRSPGEICPMGVWLGCDHLLIIHQVLRMLDEVF